MGDLFIVKTVQLRVMVVMFQLGFRHEFGVEELLHLLLDEPVVVVEGTAFFLVRRVAAAFDRIEPVAHVQ